MSASGGRSGNGRLHWFIARHYLGASRGRGLLSLITWIALGGVTIGVTALVIVIAVMTGMQEDLQGKILESTPHVVVMEQGTSLRLYDYPTVLEKIRATEGVTGAAPYVLSLVSIIRGEGSTRYTQSADLYGIAFDTVGAPPTEMARQIIDGVLDLEARSVLKRMKDKPFARAVKREDLRQGAEEIGLPLDAHIANVIAFMRERAEQLGLKGSL